MGNCGGGSSVIDLSQFAIVLKDADPNTLPLVEVRAVIQKWQNNIDAMNQWPKDSVSVKKGDSYFTILAPTFDDLEQRTIRIHHLKSRPASSFKYKIKIDNFGLSAKLHGARERDEAEKWWKRIVG